MTSPPVVEAMVASSCTVSFDEPKQVVRLGGGSTGKLIKNAFCALNEILRKKPKDISLKKGGIILFSFCVLNNY